MEMREPDDPGRGRQPKYEALVMRGEDRFALTVRLPSGETIDVPLGRFWEQTSPSAIRVDPDEQ
jgi:hypothetical protein